MTNHLRSEHVLAWRRVLAVLLALGIGLSSVEIAWGDAGVGGDADSTEVAADRVSAPQTPAGQKAPLRHAGHDADCPCLCACSCPGAVSAILPTVAFSEAPVEAAAQTVSSPDRMPLSIAPEPFLRPPLA
ncbi:MAG: hypothetical protein M3483_00645 [Gemmatimonadota bacterium]|nr:hypothetical protein [Gemmatimonadota bacterium]